MIKEQILLTAFDLFSQYGVRKVSMDDIARSTSISKRTLYEFFEDKEALLEQGLKLNAKRLTEYLDELQRGTCTSVDIILLFYIEMMKKPRWYNKQYYEDLKKFPKAMKTNDSLKSNFIKICQQLFQRGIEEGVFQPEVNFEIIALLTKDQLKML